MRPRKRVHCVQMDSYVYLDLGEFRFNERDHRGVVRRGLMAMGKC